MSQRLEQLGRNSITCLARPNSVWVLPTLHQAKSLPLKFQGKGLNVIHEGIDTGLASRIMTCIEVRVRIDRSVPVLTFRTAIERLGFDVFMQSPGFDAGASHFAGNDCW